MCVTSLALQKKPALILTYNNLRCNFESVQVVLIVENY